MSPPVGPVTVVCDALRLPALPALARTVDLFGVVVRGQRHTRAAAVPSFPDVAAALDAGARYVVFLSPYTSLTADVARCRRRGADVVTAGPLPDGDASCWVPGRACRQPGVARALDLAATETEGLADPVYLRWLGGGTGALGVWWALLEGLELARRLLDGDPAGGWLAARRAGRRWHATATLTTASGAVAQLLATPAAVAGDEWLWLASGGLVWAEGGRDAGLLQGPHGRPRLQRLASAWPDAAWVATALEALAQPAGRAPGDHALAWLRALRTAARQGRPVAMPPPAPRALTPPPAPAAGEATRPPGRAPSPPQPS